MGDPYVDPRTGVLRNRFGITDADELRSVEADVSAAALFALEASPHRGEGHFDFGHLRALHVQVFGEIYAWAGKPRTVDIARTSWFCQVRHLDDFAQSVFCELAAANYLVGLDRSTSSSTSRRCTGSSTRCTRSAKATAVRSGRS